jgi:hypothetical protein
VSERGRTMHTIDLSFQSFDDVSLHEAIARYGVYVLWKPGATRCPTYIGEGRLLGRLGQHVARFGDTVEGYFAPIDGAPGASKHDGHVAEAMLIHAAILVSREPRHNANAGRLARVIRLGNRHGVLRINVRGRDPFQPPSSSVSRLASTKTIRLDFRELESASDDDDDSRWLKLPWHSV